MIDSHVLPNFLIIGAAKSGTTALFKYLEQHPDVFISEPKEPHFLALEDQSLKFTGPGDDAMMNTRAITHLDKYKSLFASAGTSRAVGEGSVSTLYYPESISRIQKYLPDAKLIVLLRQPADRAWSAFSFMHARVHEPCQDFRDALRQEAARISEGWHHIWHYRRQGEYFRQLEPFFKEFGSDRIRVYLFEDFRRDPAAVLKDCFAFLNIDESFVPCERPSPHASGMPRSPLLQKIVTRTKSFRRALKLLVPPSTRRVLNRKFEKFNLKRERIDPEVRHELTESFRSDILQLQDLLRRDLSTWLTPGKPKD